MCLAYCRLPGLLLCSVPGSQVGEIMIFKKTPSLLFLHFALFKMLLWRSLFPLNGEDRNWRQREEVIEKHTAFSCIVLYRRWRGLRCSLWTNVILFHLLNGFTLYKKSFQATTTSSIEILNWYTYTLKRDCRIQMLHIWER